MSEETQLDAQWYDRFVECGSFHVVEYLTGEQAQREAQQKAFLAGEIENPTLDYPDIHMADIQAREEALLQLRDDIADQEKDAVVRKAYAWRLDQKIDANGILLSIAQGENDKAQALIHSVFGEPKVSIFRYTISQIRARIEQTLNIGNKNAKRAADALARALPDMDGNTDCTLPTGEAMARMRNQTVKEFAGYEIDFSDSEADAEALKKAFEHALAVSSIPGWSVIVEDSNRTGISVNQEELYVRIPQGRTLKKEALMGLVVHEIGTHVMRRHLGEQSALKLLGLGLDHSYIGEEGVATAREQAIHGEMHDFAGEAAYLAIGLAAGVDGQPRDFRQVFEIMTAYYTFVFNSGKEIVVSSDTQTTPQDRAWSRCVRTFRGTDCSTPGFVFTKDIVYREGNINIWQVIANRPKEVARFNVGKYDPANEDHLWILDQLGLTL